MQILNIIFSNIIKTKVLMFFLVIIYSLIFPIYSGKLDFLKGELGFIEILQAIIIFTSLLLNYSLKLKLRKIKANEFFINLRIFIFCLLLYEEISFLTKILLPFRNSSNWQSEFNLHNSNFMLNLVFENINIPYFNYKFSVPLDFFVISIFLIAISYGSYIFKKNLISILFLERQYSFFSIVYPINFAFNSVLLRLNLVDIRVYFTFELIELFIYLVFCSDVIFKIKKFDKL